MSSLAFSKTENRPLCFNHPVLVALELYPSRNNIAIDEIKIASAYQKNNAQALINSSTILYVDRNKKRIDRWSKFTRLQLPVNNVSVNSNTTVPQNGTGVNTHSMQNSSADVKRQGTVLCLYLLSPRQRTVPCLIRPLSYL